MPRPAEFRGKTLKINGYAGSTWIYLATDLSDEEINKKVRELTRVINRLSATPVKVRR